MYKTLNHAITKAVGVRLDPKTTVGNIQAARTELLAAYQTAFNSPDVKKAARVRTHSLIDINTRCLARLRAGKAPSALCRRKLSLREAP